jgi:spore coat polysaccharide biosynthesis protein SpsF (cytidylyltransferase family)
MFPGENSHPDCIAIVQARMGSKRFPRKVMLPFGGTPAIGHLLNAVLLIFPAGQVYVATSRNPENAPLIDYCRDRGVRVHCGDEENVASRFGDIINADPHDFFVRLNADSPLLDQSIIREAVSIAGSCEWDIVSTMPGKSYPSGMNVEVLKSETFLDAYTDFSAPRHFEHVTPFFYEQPRFRVKQVPAAIRNASRYKFSFDTEDDRRGLAALFARLRRPHQEYTLRDKCRIYDELFGDGAC